MTPPGRNNASTPEQSLDLTPAVDAGVATKSKEAAAAAPDKRAETLTATSEAMRAEVDRRQAELTAAGRPLDQATQRYLEQYFQSAIHRFDADKDNKISEAEAKSFSEAMKTKTDSIIKGMAQAAEKEGQMSAAAEKAEKMEAGKFKESLNAVTELGELSGLEQANAELQKIQGQNEAFQNSVQLQLEAVQQFSKSYNDFQQAQEGFGHFKEMYEAVTGSVQRKLAIAQMKATLESTRGAVDTVLTELKAKQKILDANGEKIKAAFSKTRRETIEARDKQKAEIAAAEQGQKEQIEARQKEYQRLENEKKKMEERRRRIAENQINTAKIREDWCQQNEADRITTQRDNCGKEKDDIAAELHGFKLILDNPDVPPSVKQGLQQEYARAQARERANKLAIEVIGLKETSAEQAAQAFNDDQKKAEQELQTADAHLTRQRETQLSLQQNIDLLNDLQSQYATSGEEVDKYYNTKISLLDEQAESVDDFVLNSSMARQQSITALEQAKTSLASLNVEAKGLSNFLNPLEAVGSLSKGIGGALQFAAKYIDNETRQLLAMTRKSEDTLDQVAYYGTQFLSIYSGFASGALELFGGVFSLSGGLVSDIGSIPTALLSWDSGKLHFQTFAGLGAIIGYDAAKGEFTWEKVGETWKAMGHALVGYGEHWGTHIDPVTGKEEKRDEYGTAIGKSVFNVLSMFVGAGEAKAAAQVGLTAAKVGSKAGLLGKAGLAGEAARLATIDAARAAGKSAGILTGRGAQMGAFAKTLAKNLRSPEFLRRAVTDAKTHPTSKTAGFAGSVGESAVEGVTTGAGTAYRGARAGYRAVREAVSHPLRTTGQAIVGGAKATGWLLKKAAKATSYIALEPYRALFRLGKTARNLGRRIVDFRGAQLAESTAKLNQAAKVMETTSANYAKAQHALREIIDGDPVLAKKAKDIADNSTLDDAAKAARQQVLEAEAAQKLASSDPALARAYLDYRRASETFSAESRRGFVAAEKEAKGVVGDPKVFTVYQEYEALQNAARAAGDSPEAKAALTAFEKDPARMAVVDRYSRAKASLDEISELEQRLQQLNQELLGQNTDQAVRLADELNEARAATAPAGSPARDLSHTDSPAFAKEFREQYQEALATNNLKLGELLDDLGTLRTDRLDEVLEGFMLRKKHNIPLENLPGRLNQQWRVKLTKELGEAIDNNNFNGYNKFKESILRGGPEFEAYINWVEEIYKNHRPDLARKIVLSSDRDFSAALRASQQASLERYAAFEKEIQEGIDLPEFEQRLTGANLPTRWQEGLRQMHAQWTLQNRRLVLNADIALNRLRTDLSKVISREMTPAEAALRLKKRYADKELSGLAAQKPGRSAVADDIILNDGKKYKVVVGDDGLVKLLDDADKVVLPERKSAPQAAPAPAPATAPAPAPAPAATTGPATTPRVSRVMQPFETREAKLLAAVQADPNLKALANQGNAGLLIARGKARCQAYFDGFAGKTVKQKLDDLRSTPTELPKYKQTPAYQQYDRYLKSKEALDAATADSADRIIKLRIAQDNLLVDELITRLDQKVTPEEAAALLAREVDGLNTVNFHTFDFGKVKLKGQKEYSIIRNSDGSLALLDDQGMRIGGPPTPTAPANAAPRPGGTQVLPPTPAPAAAAHAPAPANAAPRPGGTQVLPSAPAAAPSPAPAAPRPGGTQVLPPTPTPAAAGRTAPAAAPSPAPAAAAPAPAPAERLATAQATREQALQALRTGRRRVLELEERIPQLQRRIEAMEVRGVQGYKVNAARQSLAKLEEELVKVNKGIANNLKQLGNTRSEYWKARLLQKGQAIRDYVGVSRRIEWLKNKNRTLGELAQRGVNLLRNPARELWQSLRKQIDTATPLGENTTAEFARMYLFGRAGMEVVDRLDNLHRLAAGRLPAALPVLAELRLDQYRLLAKIQKGSDRSLGLPATEQEFAAMSPQEQTAALGGAYGQLEGGAGLPESPLAYNEAQKTYLNHKRNLARQTLSSLGAEGTELNTENVTAALDNAFGPQGGNDAAIDYQIEVEGVKIHVDKDGKRSYEGIDQWVAAAPTRNSLRGLLSETEQVHATMTPADLLKANGDEVKAPEIFKQYLVRSISTGAIRKLAGQGQAGAVAESTTLNQQGDPVVIARVNQQGQVEVTVDPDWASGLYEGIKGRPDQPAPAAEPAPARVATAPALRLRRHAEKPDEPEETDDSSTDDSYDPYA